jgi:hypothetical protein
VDVQPYDCAGRQGAVDALLRYRDGRVGALEVTWLAAPGAQQLDRLVAAEAFSWELPGRWQWTVAISDPRDLPRLRRCFISVVLWCEAHEIENPRQYWRAHGEPIPEDVLWAASGSVTFLGNRRALSVNPDGRRGHAWLTHYASGVLVDHSLAGLTDALQTALGETHMPRHLEKLRLHPDVDERHLFLPVHLTGLGDQIGDALLMGTTLPPETPPLPEKVTHLWLAHHFGERVLLGTADGWSERHPYGR